MIRSTETTTDEAAAVLGCCRQNITRKVQAAEEIIEKLLEDPCWLARSRRADRVAESLWRRLGNLGRLVAADPAGSRQWIRRLVDETCGHRLQACATGKKRKRNTAG